MLKPRPVGLVRRWSVRAESRALTAEHPHSVSSDETWTLILDPAVHKCVVRTFDTDVRDPLFEGAKIFTAIGQQVVQFNLVEGAATIRYRHRSSFRFQAGLDLQLFAPSRFSILFDGRKPRRWDTSTGTSRRTDSMIGRGIG
jgi:hypothetical protein